MIEIRDSADALFVADVSVDTASPGVPFTETELHIYNNFGGSGAETIDQLFLEVLARDAGAGNDYAAEGHEFIDRHYMEAMISSGLGGLTAQATSWQRIGAGARLALPVLANAEGVDVRVRVDAPVSVPGGVQNYLAQLTVLSRDYLPGAGALPNGVIGGSSGPDEIYATTDVVENPGGVDDQVQYQATEWCSQGNVHNATQALIQLDANDGSSVALASGEAYYGIVVGTVEGTIAVRKGDKATTPLTASDEPALEVGDVELALVLREFDGLIHDADITNRYDIGAFDYLGATGLTATIGKGTAHVNRNEIPRQLSSQVTLVANDTNYVWVQPDGSDAVTQALAQPVPGAMRIWDLPTNATTVTTPVDRRQRKGTGVNGTDPSWG